MINQETILRAQFNALYGPELGPQLFKTCMETCNIWVTLAERKDLD